MLFWKVVGDGEGEGGGCLCRRGGDQQSGDEGCEQRPPTTLCSPLDRLMDGSRSVLLKMETSTVGGWSRLRLCSRCERSWGGL